MIRHAIQAILHLRATNLSDGTIDLMQISASPDPSLGIDECQTFRISPSGTRQYAGYVSLRVGESPSLYYLGHIGYRVEPAFRGHHFAERACRLIEPLAYELGMRTLVITCDTGNTPSRKTCEHLGCLLERIADVPIAYRSICAGSCFKCRYILFTHEAARNPIN